MSTQYSLSDILPKDATGQPIFAPVDISTSQVDFALQAGIAPSTVSGKRYAYQGVATHKQGDTQTVTGPGIVMFGIAGTPLSVGGNLQIPWLTTQGALNVVPYDSYTFVASGSTAASADTAHGMFGNYGGLSSLATSVILYTEVMATINGAAIFNSSAKLGRGILLSASAIDYKILPPMTRENLDDLHIANRTAGANTTVNWFVFRRD